MPFPEYQRVIYGKNPLESVICQLRFPPILKIDSELPVDFQERLRSEYPLLNERSATEISTALPPEIGKLLSPQLKASLSSDRRIYDFSSADHAWQISLARDFIALTATKYRKWEDFRARFFTALEAFENIYKPAFFSRIGLRYRDVIRRSVLDLKDVEWAELLQQHIAGELGSPDIARATKGVKRDLVVGLSDDKGQVRVQHGLIRPEGTEEVCYLID